MHRLHLETFGPVHALPVLHYRMEFAALVRRAVERLKPDCIALELPPTVEEQFLRGVRRLPQVSVVSYDAGGRAVHLMVEPADPLAEGARCALEAGIPLSLIDLDMDDYPRFEEPLPDSYAVQRIGLAPYYREVAAAEGSFPPSEHDLRRERGMAWRLQRLAERHSRILLICGMAHVKRVKGFFAEPQARPLERVRREAVRLANLHPESCGEVMGEYPFVSALYDYCRNTLPPEPPRQQEPSLRKRFSMLELIEGGKEDVSEEEALTASLLRSARHVGGESGMPDRQRMLLRLFQEASAHYRQETGEAVRLWQKRAFFRFCRNYAFLERMLLPNLFQVLTAARGCVDDNFAYACWRLAVFLPWQKSEAEIPTIRLSVEELYGGALHIRFRPKQKGRPKGLSHLGFLNRKREKRPGEWLQGFDDNSICSYPPEDLVIEEYGRFLKKKGAKQLSEEEGRSEPFTASLLDGIDMRETLRNLHEGRIYVRENRRVKGGVGSVVVIFDEDKGSGKYPYLMTWLGEHEQESDMAFYATSPADNVAGPGISRCEYGGFILSYPPRRMADVWTDPDYRFARTKSEILLLAALDYSPERHVVYAAAKPPRSFFRQLAARMGKQIVYISLGSLSSVKLKKIRVLHVLFGHDKREVAKDYIW